jgi:hypothetical protein
MLKGPADEPPDSAACCGLQAELSARLKAALFVPDDAGENVTSTVQLEPLVKVFPQLLLDIAKSLASGPVTEMLEKFVSLLLLLIVKESGVLLVPGVTCPKLRLFG